jgi:hypothetical protein
MIFNSGHQFNSFPRVGSDPILNLVDLT